MDFGVYEDHALQIMHLHSHIVYAYEENRSRIGAVSTGTATHVEI